MEHDLPSMPFPLCIVPDGKTVRRGTDNWNKLFLGTTNIICHTIQGNTDHCTPLLNLLFSEIIQIDFY